MFGPRIGLKHTKHTFEVVLVIEGDEDDSDDSDEETLLYFEEIFFNF